MMPLLHQLTDQVRGSRMLWGGVCWVITFVLAGFGVPFLIVGTKVTSVPNAYAAIRELPGGVHTYGGVMVLLAIAMLHGLLPTSRARGMDDAWLHATLRFVAVFAGSAALAFAWSWVMSGLITYQAIIYWVSLTLFAVLAFLFPPYAGRPERAT